MPTSLLLSGRTFLNRAASRGKQFNVQKFSAPIDLDRNIGSVNSSATLPNQVRNRVEMELRSGERIVWAGQPIPARFVRVSWLLVVFGIFWTAFSIFWVVGASFVTSRGSTPGPFMLFPLFGVPFVAIGIGMLTSPIWMRKKAANTAYVITDQRAFVLSQTFRKGTQVQNFDPKELQSLEHTQYPDGSGDIIFFTERWRDSDGDRRTRRMGFYAVRDVKTVEQHLRGLAQKHSLPPPV